MSKIKLWLNVAADLRALSDSVEEIAKAIEEPYKAKESLPTKKAEPKITLEQVRTILAEKSNSGYTAQVRELLKKYGADKLSSINPSKYADLLADAEVLGDGK